MSRNTRNLVKRLLNAFHALFLIFIGSFSLLSHQSYSQNSGKPLVSTVESANFFESSDRYSKVLGILPFGSIINIVPGYEKLPGEFYHVEARSESSGKILRGFVLKSEFESSSSAFRTQKAKQNKNAIAKEKSEDSLLPWSFGVGLSGTSSGNNTSVVVAAEVRYLWYKAFESYTGLDLSLGNQSSVGLRVGNRAYAPFDGFRPYVQLGFRIRDLSAFDSSAYEMGGGIQVVRNHGAYFELGALFLHRTSFDAQAENYWVFGGSSGFRF